MTSTFGSVCGVVVREGNHVLGVTMCLSGKGSNGWYPVQLIEYLRSDDPRKGVIVKKSSTYYEVPFTAIVKVLGIIIKLTAMKLYL